MTPENKELLLQDICARLPYGIMIKEEYGDYINVNLYNAHLEHLIDRISEGLDKLVLRPMSSMTEEEKEEFESLWDEGFGEALDAQLNGQNDLEVKTLEITASYKSIQWLLKNHFDFMGLIPKGLAIEITENNNPYKE